MEASERKQEAFMELKVYCLELLDILNNPTKSRSSRTLLKMHGFLRKSSAADLQPLFDCTLFPLLLLLDASIDSRSSKMKEPGDKILMHNLSANKMIHDITAEGMLHCLEELLKKCSLTSLDQMVLLLRKLSSGAMLSHFEASEEFHEGVIRCFRAILSQLSTCFISSCACQQGTCSPEVLKNRNLDFFFVKPSAIGNDQSTCLLAFLRSEDASVAVGHWLSLLLKTADVEATLGRRGSSKLRIEAFSTFRLLVAKVGSADALAFFLPGVVSQLAKALHSSKSIMSGAGGKAEAAYHAIRGLSEFLMIVLANDANTTALDILAPSHPHLGNDDSAKSALKQLIRFADLNSQGEKSVVSDLEIEDASFESSKIVNKVEPDHNYARSFRIGRSVDWIRETSKNVDKILKAIFPEISTHPAKIVRSGVLASVKGLLSVCSSTLIGSRLMLMECLCVLASDESDEVATGAQDFIKELSTSKKLSFEQEFVELIHIVIGRVKKAFLNSDERCGLAHVKKLLALLYYAGPRLVLEHFLYSPVSSTELFDVLSLCLRQNSKIYGSLDKILLDRTTCSATQPYPELLNINESRDADYYYYRCPRFPPRFDTHEAIVQILRLVGLFLFTDTEDTGIPSIAFVPLRTLIHLISQLQIRESGMEDWQSWCRRTGDGNVLRQASIAARILNEIVFGVSDHSVQQFRNMFGRRPSIREADDVHRPHVIEYVRIILHEYLSHELWKLPQQQQHDDGGGGETDDVSVYFLQDVAMLQQVLIEGIGAFGVSLGIFFESSGFLRSSLFLLFENLSAPNAPVAGVARSVLHLLSVTYGYQSLGEFVSGNVDYLVDDISRQLRHLELYPRLPNLLSGMLSLIGEAERVLPLLEEAIQSVSAELEILGRKQHPGFTLPFLKAMAEITKASERDSRSMVSRAQSLCSADRVEAATEVMKFTRYRRTVGSITGTCVACVTPILASEHLQTCLFALAVIEDGMESIARVQQAFRVAADSPGAALQSDDADDENRLLPAMNKIWPFLIACVKRRDFHPAVLQRCVGVVGSLVATCGGDFFARRFHTDGSHFWNLLSASPFAPEGWMLLPFRKTRGGERPSEMSRQRVQVAVLGMVARLSGSKKSAGALDAVVKRVSGIVVGIACSGVVALREPAVNALCSLASIDPDLIWLLLADVARPPSLSSFLPPRPPPHKDDYLFAVYGGKSFGFDVHQSSASHAFERLHNFISTFLVPH